MKYKLVTTGKKCCPEKCTWKLFLQSVEDGYDLIQLKRGMSSELSSLVLEPGEPAFVLDTGKLYIGNLDGTSVLINPATITKYVYACADARIAWEIRFPDWDPADIDNLIIKNSEGSVVVNYTMTSADDLVTISFEEATAGFAIFYLNN